MRTSTPARLALGVPLIVAGFLATAAMRRSQNSAPAPECTFTSSGSAPVGPDPSSISLTLTQSVGDSLSAVFPPESNVTVVGVGRTKDDGPLDATLVINTVRATASKWDVSVRGEKGVCTGKILIGPTPPRPRGGTTTLSHVVGARECAAFMEDSIIVGSDRIEAIVKFSEPAGDSLSASFPKEAGIAVIAAKRTSSDDPLSAHLTLNTVRAVAGQWKLTLAGDQNTCSGNVYVGRTKR